MRTQAMTVQAAGNDGKAALAKLNAQKAESKRLEATRLFTAHQDAVTEEEAASRAAHEEVRTLARGRW